MVFIKTMFVLLMAAAYVLGVKTQAFGCDILCKCEMTSLEVKVTCVGPDISEVPVRLPRNTTELYLSGTSIRVVSAGTFDLYPFLTELFFRDTSTDPCQLEYLEPGVFDNMEKLEALGMIGCGKLTSLNAGVLGSFKNLETLQMYRNGLTSVPNLSFFKTANQDMEGLMKEMDFHGNKITKIKAYDFYGIQTDMLKLDENDITSIEGYSFENATVVHLFLNKNKNLQNLHENAFAKNKLILNLDLSETKIETLPTAGLKNIRKLIIKDTPSLKHFPTVLEFSKIEVTELTYPHHCCAFKNPEIQNPAVWRAKARQAQESINRECALSTSTSTPASALTPRTMGFGKIVIPGNETRVKRNTIQYINGIKFVRHKRNFGDFADETFGKTIDDNETNFGFGPIKPLDNNFGSFGENDKNSKKTESVMVFHTTYVDDNITQQAFCGEIYIYNRNVTCTPEPDAFNPCEDVMGYIWLRVIVWFVLLAALLGNSVVLIVIMTSRGKLSVPKFLMCNLAFADFIMGVYLLLLASIDVHTLGEYFNYAIRWQNEGGCQAAGFLSVFSSELSVFTLTILTLERWYAISHAIHLNKRLKLRQSVALMALGYTFASVLATLPLVGISGYGNVSICLPMKAVKSVDIGYVVSLLIMNGVMFLSICFCYVSMYWQVKGSATTARSNDATIAKRMALLVFTNFACWAPIAFFGLTASAGVPLIDITNSKILLVFFYPLNSCANPFLYAILTKQFRKDVFILLGKYGICVEKANMYRGTMTSRSMSQSRNHHKDVSMRCNMRYREPAFSHFHDSAHGTRGTVTAPKIYPFHRDHTETQPFLRKSHTDRAAEFANKEPVLSDENDSVVDLWDASHSKSKDQVKQRNHPPYIRSVSDYAKFCGVRKLQKLTKTRQSVDTFMSNSTDTTYVSDVSNTTQDDVWQLRDNEDNNTEQKGEGAIESVVYNANANDSHAIAEPSCYIVSNDCCSESTEQSPNICFDKLINQNQKQGRKNNGSGDLKHRLSTKIPLLSRLDETTEIRCDQLNCAEDIVVLQPNDIETLDKSKESGFHSSGSIELDTGV
ncbi:thyrotropin receptor-like [Mya arenaria]|uniref:thyrotropin receptor-like n=1 Tax=Mya arenaria TaxID=6604 RepID=UPI0022DF0045|nr:thyrotropin receptor-like [Mya arenaria]